MRLSIKGMLVPLGIKNCYELDPDLDLDSDTDEIVPLVPVGVGIAIGIGIVSPPEIQSPTMYYIFAASKLFPLLWKAVTRLGNQASLEEVFFA